MIRTSAITIVLAALAIAATRAPSLPTSGKVVKVYDGDTITIESDGKKHNVRLAGIDCPERSYTRLLNQMERMNEFAPLARRRELAAAMKPYRAHAKALQTHAKEARKALAGMVDGKAVSLAYDSKEPARDRYKRIVAFVSIDGADVNAEMIRKGLAIAERRYPCDRGEQYIAAMRGAQAGKVGLWQTRPE